MLSCASAEIYLQHGWAAVAIAECMCWYMQHEQLVTKQMLAKPQALLCLHSHMGCLVNALHAKVSGMHVPGHACQSECCCCVCCSSLHESLHMTVAIPLLWGIPPRHETLRYSMICLTCCIFPLGCHCNRSNTNLLNAFAALLLFLVVAMSRSARGSGTCMDREVHAESHGNSKACIIQQTALYYSFTIARLYITVLCFARIHCIALRRHVRDKVYYTVQPD